jgi:hypothetical protein
MELGSLLAGPATQNVPVPGDFRGWARPGGCTSSSFSDDWRPGRSAGSHDHDGVVHEDSVGNGDTIQWSRPAPGSADGLSLGVRVTSPSPGPARRSLHDDAAVFRVSHGHQAAAAESEAADGPRRCRLLKFKVPGPHSSKFRTAHPTPGPGNRAQAHWHSGSGWQAAGGLESEVGT